MRHALGLVLRPATRGWGCWLGSYHQTGPRPTQSFPSFSSFASSEDAYLESWQQKKIQPPSFYEQEALKRHYFYTVDLQGRLYLEESRVKNLTSCLKDDKFLNFFFRQVRRNDTGLHPSYPFVSPCGKEMNFILPADMPLVFHDFVREPTEGEKEGGRALVYAGNLQQEFDPSSIYISSRSGRLHHPLNTSKKGRGTAGAAAAAAPAVAAAAAAGHGEKEEGREAVKQGGRPQFGLLRSHVGLLLSDRLVHAEEDGGGLMLMWGGEGGEEEGFIIRMLPEEEEPVWGMPPY